MRTVKCTHLGHEAPGLDVPPFLGPIGKEIFENVSQEAWAAWLEMQTKIINEYRLDLSEPEGRVTLMSQMRAFLKLPSQNESLNEVLSVGKPT
jgi:Fe-S cluster biosynthesis and repair protein YggX